MKPALFPEPSLFLPRESTLHPLVADGHVTAKCFADDRKMIEGGTKTIKFPGDLIVNN